MKSRRWCMIWLSLFAAGAGAGCAGLVSGTNPTTGNPPPPSTLVISNVQSGAITTSGSQVAWTTNVPADSSVDYGTTAAYGISTPIDSTMVTSHQITVSGLAAGTTYYYQVNSTDSKGNHGHGGGKFNTAGFSLSGTINPAAAGAGASVALSGAASASVTADSSGNYTFPGLSNGSYTVTPGRNGYVFTPGSQSAAVNGANITAVNFSANAAPLAPSITTQPAGQTVTAGQTASFSVAATGTAPLTYQWSKNGTAIPGATSSNYTTPATTSSDNRAQFTVVVSNPAGSVTSNAATLTVSAAPAAPSITTQPASQTVIAGQTASFSVAATGTAPLTYQWNKNGTAIPGATSSSYATPATTNSDNGAQFTVVVSNPAGSVTSNAASLTVNAAPVVPSITTQPASQTVTTGQTASFSVAATGTAPLGYQWNKNGAAITGATLSSYTTPVTTAPDNGAQFTVVVSNSAGSVTSSPALLTVNSPSSQLNSTPSGASFGNVAIGSSNSQTISLFNSGVASLTISQATVSGAGFSISGLPVPTTIAAGQSTTFNVAFTPTSAAAVTGSLSLVSSASNSRLTIPLSGTGVAATFLLGANPTALSFGNVNLGSSSSLPVTLTNTGNSNVTISAVTPSGTGFGASGVSAGTLLTPNQSATLNVSFAPTAAGSVAGSVAVASNATNSPASISLSAAGLATPPTVAISSPANGATVSGTITVSGTASDSLGISSVAVQFDGGAFSPASGTTSWTFSLDTTPLSNAALTLTARATDTVGTTASTSVSVNVSNGSSGPIINVQNYGATGNGSTDDIAAINSAIAALQPGYQLFFPCGTYLISSGLNAITVNNATIYGQGGCGGGTVMIRSTGSGSTVLQVGSGTGLTGSTPILASTADGDTTFQANFSAISAGVGDYVFLEETVSTSDTSHTNCGGSGCRGEILKITGVNSNIATVETAVHHVYDTACCVPWVQKIPNPTTGVSVHDLILDGSGVAYYGLAVLDAVNTTMTNLTSQHVAWSAVAGWNGYNNSYNNITVTHAGQILGGNFGGDAVTFTQQGNLSVNGMSLSNLNSPAFGFGILRTANSTLSNISVDGTGTGSGRMFKTNSAAHNTFNSISTNRDEGAYYQGITIEYFSHHNVWNNCKVTNNINWNNSGIVFYGDVANGNHEGSNHYNTFNNCAVSGNNGYAVWVLDNNNYIEINGGTYSGIAGEYVIAFDDSSPCCTNNAYIHNATINGPGSTGVWIASGSANACINNNTFGPGLTAAINVTAPSDMGSGNVLNGLSSNLNPGTCGTSGVSVSVSPSAPTVASGGTQQFTTIVTGTSNIAVTWTASAGSISSSGLFTAPTVSANTNLTVTATSQADTTKTASASVTVTPANTFGYAVQGASVGTTMSNSVTTSRYQMTGQNGTVTSMSVFIASPISASPNNQFQVAIYADNNGTPGALIASSASQTIVPDAWNTASISAPVTANTFYWLAYNTNGLAANTNNLRYDLGGATSSWITSEPFGTWPATYGPVGGTSSYSASIYATYQ